MLDKLKTYLSIDEEQEPILEIIIDNAEAAFEDFTGRLAADYPTIVLKMCVEDYNRLGSEGIGSLSFGGGSESVLGDYSDGLCRQIRRLKKVRVM